MRRRGRRRGPPGSRAGDVAIARGPDPYLVADAPGTPAQAIILPGSDCTTPDGAELKLMDFLGTREWGNSADGETVMLTGTYQLDGEVSRRLLRALPPLLVLEGDAWETPLIGLLAEEIVKDEPGQEAVLDRLLDLLLIAVLRTWFARPEAQAPGWYRAHGGPDRRPRAARPARRPGAPVDGRRARRRRRCLARRARPPLQ